MGGPKKSVIPEGGGLILSAILCGGGLASTPLTFKQVVNVSRQPHDSSGGTHLFDNPPPHLLKIQYIDKETYMS